MDKASLELGKLFIQKESLTREEIIACDFDEQKIKEMIEKKILKIENDKYILIDSHLLTLYGNYLIKLKNKQEAIKVFEKAYLIEPDRLMNNFYMFLFSIDKNEYEKSWIYFEKIYNGKKEMAENNVYLYLLNLIIDLPLEYQKIAANLKMTDLLGANNQENEIRKLIFQRRLTYAINKMIDYFNQKDNITMKDYLLRLLLFEARNATKKDNKKINDLIKEEKIAQLIVFLEKKQLKTSLNKNESQALLIAKKSIELQNTLLKPNPTIFKTTNIFEAIEGQNYELALELAKKYSLEKNIPLKDNIIYNILVYLNKLIANYNSKITIYDLKDLLLNNDILNFQNYLKEILKTKEKSSFLKIMIEIYKLGLYLNDFSLAENILNNNLEINFNYLKEEYLDSLIENDLKKAKIYLNIIKYFQNLTNEDLKVRNLINLYNLCDERIDNLEFTEEYIYEKAQELLEKKGIIILDYDENIYNYIGNIPNIKALEIKDGFERKIVLYYEDPQKVILDYRLVEISRNAYEFDDFEKSLDINLYLLSQGNIQSYMFERIGKIYYHLGLDKEALDYLIVARSLMSKENKQCGFNSLIKELKLKGDKNEKKRKRIM
ncbi:MAG: hypothetical protein E7172_04125 [Firmicutes bacterium]|nr:hypothetical protein [Bacillota bacterium]